MKKLIAPLIIIVFILPGCITKKACNRKFPPETIIIRKDSVIHKTVTIYSDTIIYYQLPGDTVIDSVIIFQKGNQLIVKPSHLSTSFAKSDAWIKNNKLHHILIQNDTLLKFKLENAVKTTWERAEKYYNKQETKFTEKRFVPLIYKVLSIIGVMAIVFIALWFFLKM